MNYKKNEIKNVHYITSNFVVLDSVDVKFCNVAVSVSESLLSVSALTARGVCTSSLLSKDHTDFHCLVCNYLILFEIRSQ